MRYPPNFKESGNTYQEVPNVLNLKETSWILSEKKTVFQIFDRHMDRQTEGHFPPTKALRLQRSQQS